MHQITVRAPRPVHAHTQSLDVLQNRPCRPGPAVEQFHRMSFGEKGIEPADGFAGDGFIVRPLVPSDVVLDHEAVMSSREFPYHWEQDPPYPSEDFPVEDNLEDLLQMTANIATGPATRTPS